MFREAKLSPPEKEALARAQMYVACAFRGRATYERREGATFEEALRLASDLYADDGRGVGIYAIDANGHQAMLGSWYPDR